MGNKKSKQLAAEIAAETDVKPVAAAAVPTEKTTIASRMNTLAAVEFRFAPPKRKGSMRGSLGLFDEDGGLIEAWTCSKTVTAVLTAISTDETLTKEQRELKAHRYALTLVLSWVTAQNGDVMQIVSESRDFSNGFSF